MISATTMNPPACFRGTFVRLPQCSSCCDLRFQPFVSSSINSRRRRRNLHVKSPSRLVVSRYGVVKCRATETDTEPEDSGDKEREVREVEETPESTNSSGSVMGNDKEKDNAQPSQLEALNKLLNKAQGLTNEDKGKPSALEALNKLLNKDGAEANAGELTEGQFKQLDTLKKNDGAETKAQGITEDVDNVEITSGSTLPGVKTQRQEDLVMIPQETIDILKNEVFGFDTFFVTSYEQYESYEGGILFKGNLRGQAAISYEKIAQRLKDSFGDQYNLFLLLNPEDDKPVAVVLPRKALQPETTAVPEWLAAGAFGLVTVFTLLLRNVPALQSNLLSIFVNVDLLKNGLPGALVTALALGVHEISHILVASSCGIKLGVPYFVPSWQIGSFGAITRILNIAQKREDLLKVAAAGPLAGFLFSFVLLLLGFYLPPADGIGVVVDASVFHESLLAGGIAKLLLGDVLKEGATISINPLVIWAWAGLLINAINSIPAGELDGGRISFAIWGRKVSSRLTSASIVLLGLSSLINDVAFYWVVLIFFLQRGPIAPLSEEITDPDSKYVGLGITVLLLGLLVCLPYPIPFTTDAMTSLL